MRNNETLQKLEDGEPDDLIAEMDNVVSRSSALVDNLDGWQTGGRLPAQHKSELKVFILFSFIKEKILLIGGDIPNTT